MKKVEKDLAAFEGREEALRKVTRYSLYHTMFYRTNLWTHTRRVAWIVEKISPLISSVFGEAYNANRAYALALVHDDAETIFGDVQAGNKSKMIKEELQEVENAERRAVETLAEQYPPFIDGLSYKELMLDAVDKNSIEAMVVDWADKYDAFCEALHELHGGNAIWTEHVVNEYGTIALPTEYYMNYFSNFSKKFPSSAAVFSKDSSWFCIPPYPDEKEIVSQALPHTIASLKQKTGYQQYDDWLELTFLNGTTEDIENLYFKKE